jgi:phosphatidylserine/phosphatidylglycerophosphate/cardiolipin synthase-like enzyme
MLAKAIPPLAQQRPPQPQRPQLMALQRLAERLTGTPVLGGNTLVLDGETNRILERMAADIDAAQRSLLMEFYIWNAGGLADGVLEAVKRAAARGVACRLLIDDLGAIDWWRGPQPALLRAAGGPAAAGAAARPRKDFVGPRRSSFASEDCGHRWANRLDRQYESGRPRLL